MKYYSQFLAVTSVLLTAGGAIAQTTTPPTTPTTMTPCPSATTPVLASFTLERVLNPTQITSTATPVFPSGLLTAVNTNVVEIREAFNYNTQNHLLTLNLFSVQTGSPLPTPTNGIVPASIFGILAVSVDKVYTSCTPTPSVMFVGTVATNSPASPFGNLTGAPIAVSMALTNATTTGTGGTTGGTGGTTGGTPGVASVAVLIAGTAVEFSAAGTGTVTFTGTSVVPPGSTGGPNIVVANAGPTSYRIVDLNATGTTGNGTLTYQWTVVAGAADIANAKSATATAYIEGGAGSYTFRVTVTDSAGNVATKDVTVQFL